MHPEHVYQRLNIVEARLHITYTLTPITKTATTPPPIVSTMPSITVSPILLSALSRIPAVWQVAESPN